MGYSINKYPYIGSRDFDVNFTLGYISRGDVFVYIEDELDSEGEQLFREFNWLNDNRIRVVDEIANGSTVVVQRIVTKQDLALDFSVSGDVTRGSLETGFKQLLMTVHELYDGALGDRAIPVSLPQDIENGLAFVSKNSEELLAVAELDSEVLAQLTTAIEDTAAAALAAQSANAGAASSLASSQVLLDQMQVIAATITTSAAVLKFYGLQVNGSKLTLEVGTDNYVAEDYLWYDANADPITFSIDSNGHLLLQNAA